MFRVFLGRLFVVLSVIFNRGFRMFFVFFGFVSGFVFFIGNSVEDGDVVLRCSIV